MASTFGDGEIIVATEARKFVVKQLQIVEYTVTCSAYDLSTSPIWFLIWDFITINVT